MAWKRHSAEDILKPMREIGLQSAGSADVATACRSAVLLSPLASLDADRRAQISWCA